MKDDQVARIGKAIARWEDAVSWIEDGWDCEEEYNEDVGMRHKVFLLLENNNDNLPVELKTRLEVADARYRAATVDDWPFSSSFSTVEFDRERNWYWFRRPEEASMLKAWKNNEEFRSLVMMASPVNESR